MDAFLISTGIVALAEIGDKTRIASIVLAAYYSVPLSDEQKFIEPSFWTLN